MHMVIRAIVPASDKEEALQRAKQVFDQLCEGQRPFDYYTTFDNWGSTVSGPARWGNLPMAAKAASKAGGKLVREGWNFTKREFRDNLKHVQKALEQGHTWRELMSEECGNPTHALKPEKRADGRPFTPRTCDLILFRHKAEKLGQYEGSANWLYDWEGEAIRDEEHLKRVLELYRNAEWMTKEEWENKYGGKEPWVVPADVHY
jgi:hypothetical protein